LLQVVTVSAQPLDISREDQVALETLAEECLGTPLLLDRGDITGSPDHNIYGVSFLPHESTANRTMHYVMRLQRDGDQRYWLPQEVTLYGEQFLPGFDEPTYLGGFIESAEAEAVFNLIDRYWREHVDRGQIEVNSMTSTARPRLYCAYDNLSSQADAVYYTVIASSKQVPRHRPQPEARNGIRMSAFTSADGGFSFSLFTERPGSRLQIRDVDCAGMPNTCDPEVLAELMEGLDSSAIVAAREERRRAVLSVLPAQYSPDEAGSIQRSTWQGQETLLVNLEPKQVSDNRVLHAVINCSRPLDSSEVWRCMFQPSTYTQQLISGGVVIVSAVDLSEQAVERLADTVRQEIGDTHMFMLGATPTGYQISASDTTGQMYDLVFDSGLGLVTVTARRR